MASRLPALATLAVLAACTTPPAPAPDGEPPSRTVISLPLDIGKLKLESLHEYPDPRLGSVYGYAGEFALFPDVYVYPNPFLGRASPAAVMAASPGWAADSFRDEMAYVVEQGAYESARVTEVSDVVHDWKYGALAGQRVSLTTVRDGQEFYSRAYFFAVQDLLVKVRISHFDYPGLGENMDWFVDELIAGARVVHYDENGGAVIGVGTERDVEEQVMSRMDDLVVVRTRNALMEKAVSETRDGTIHYGEFEREEPITGPVEDGRAPRDDR